MPDRRANQEASSETFQAIAEEWIQSRSNSWSPSYGEAVHSALAANLYAQIGGIPVRSITVPISGKPFYSWKSVAPWQP